MQRRILGEIPVAPDGSFNVEIPANTPVELQILDADGLALRSCGWIWARNHEPRGCIGCHEDGELVPENWFVEAAGRASIPLCLPPERRRSVDFRRDVRPIIAAKCAPCHSRGLAPIRLDGRPAPGRASYGKARFSRDYENLLSPRVAENRRGRWQKYVEPGSARTSPLVWHLFGRDTSRPWDNIDPPGPVIQMPPFGSEPLSEDERRTLVEWIDLGAAWDGIPGPDDLTSHHNGARGENE